MRRRHFLNLSAASVGGLLVPLRVPLRFFTQTEARVVAAAAARIFPSDETGPGAAEAGVALYIDRQLAGPYGRDRRRYTQPPFVSGLPEQGYQGAATPAETYREGLKQLRGFHLLEPAEQDRRLRAIESTRFFSLLRAHTIEGMFCDPMHGGNSGLVGWRLIGFPGPRMSYAAEIERYYGRPFRPRPASLRQILGKPVRPAEDEA